MSGLAPETALRGAGYFCLCVLCSVAISVSLPEHLPQSSCGSERKSIPINYTTN